MPRPAKNQLTSFFWSGDAIRSRSVSDVVLHGSLDIPAPPVHVSTDWAREISRLELEAGDVESLPLARTIIRWKEYSQCVRAMSDWLHTYGLTDLLAAADGALMTCNGARYHHDGAQYGGAAFCNLFLSEDKGLDLYFPLIAQRIPLHRGSAVIFDTGQPHAVVPRDQMHFSAADFAAGQDWNQLFLTWELPIENSDLQHALGVTFDIDASSCAGLNEAQLMRNGAPAVVCPTSGQWLSAASALPGS
jgi:hypothetical protein